MVQDKNTATKLSVNKIKEEARKASVYFFQRSNSHIQLLGHYLVNYYPDVVNGPVIYIPGMPGGGIKFDGCEYDLVTLSTTLLEPFVPKDMAIACRARGTEVSDFLSALRRSCFWCNKPFMSFNDVNLTHIGSLNPEKSHGYDNIALACSRCINTVNKPAPKHEVGIKVSPDPLEHVVPLVDSSQEIAACNSNTDDHIEPKYDKETDKLDIRLPKSLYKKLYKRAMQEGVSINELIIYLLSSISL